MANLEDGFRVAADPASRGMGALVVLNDEINSAREVDEDGFAPARTRSVRATTACWDRVRSRACSSESPSGVTRPKSEFDVAAIKALPRVDVILTYQGAPGDLIKAAVDNGAKGIVIAGAGAAAISGTQGEGIDLRDGEGRVHRLDDANGQRQRRHRWPRQARRPAASAATICNPSRRASC